MSSHTAAPLQRPYEVAQILNGDRTFADGPTRRRHTRTAHEAQALAKSWVGPAAPQITITAHGSHPGTFAVKHYVWNRHTGTKVSDWSTWHRGTYTGKHPTPPT